MTITANALNATDLRRLEANHQQLLDLGFQLEQAMEETGLDLEYAKLRRLSAAILLLLKDAHDLEERVLFPGFDRRAGSCFSVMMIEHLKAEHRYDRLAADELRLTLQALADGTCSLPIETITRMLTGFLECLRRHVSTEKLLMEALLAAEAEEREIFA
uniref:Calcium or iron-binding protein n=1 Tax=Pseudomonas sp. G-179 TaxID=71238 RepID=Q9Z3V4_9HYPH|nr:calcium or iron-binding protein [Pseudomonas sp. G-179]